MILHLYSSKHEKLFLITQKIRRIQLNTYGWIDIKLTQANVDYTVSAINYRGSRMISKKISFRIVRY
jgi:hypothetical protein